MPQMLLLSNLFIIETVIVHGIRTQRWMEYAKPCRIYKITINSQENDAFTLGYEVEHRFIYTIVINDVVISS